jgi:hypothetical protein
MGRCNVDASHSVGDRLHLWLLHAKCPTAWTRRLHGQEHWVERSFEREDAAGVANAHSRTLEHTKA